MGLDILKKTNPSNYLNKSSISTYVKLVYIFFTCNKYYLLSNPKRGEIFILKS